MQACMKRTLTNLPQQLLRSQSFQMKLELMAGAVFTAALMRWLM